MNNKTVIVITGPTAVGKTAAAIRLAQWLNTKIISADSRQCFTELNIGVAKPSREELQQVHHYFINSHTIHEEVNAALFEQLALQWAGKILQEKDMAVMVGGTGLYVKAFCEGLDDIPPVALPTREAIQLKYAAEGMSWLQMEIEKQDPDFYRTGEIQNPQRVMRALEVKLSTGRSILSYRTQQKKQRPFNIVKVGLHLSREQLHQNINSRVERMLEAGLIDEVKNLLPCQHLNALQTVGYTELFNYLEGRSSLEEAVALIQKNTRHYAKRQMTWFRKDATIQWIAPDDWEALKKITQY